MCNFDRRGLDSPDLIEAFEPRHRANCPISLHSQIFSKSGDTQCRCGDILWEARKLFQFPVLPNGIDVDQSVSPTTVSQSLLDRITRGEADALERWFHEYKDPLYSFVFFRVGNDPELAADVTQSTFTAALSRLPEFDPQRGEMVTWLRFLSRNFIRDALAKRRTGDRWIAIWDRIDHQLRDALERLDEQPLPDAVVERQETRELVAMTLANLPSHYRDVLQAKYLNQESIARIAEMRETTVDAVKSLLRRARTSFRECFLTIAKLEIEDV